MPDPSGFLNSGSNEWTSSSVSHATRIPPAKVSSAWGWLSLAEAVLDDVLPGGFLEALDLRDRVAADHRRVVPLGVFEGRGDDVLGHRVDVVAEGVAGGGGPDRRE